jgi:hypothetical protein
VAEDALEHLVGESAQPVRVPLPLHLRRLAIRAWGVLFWP